MEPMGSITTPSLIILFLKPQINTDEHRYKSKEQRDDIFHICVYPCSSVVPRILFVNFETTDERRSIWVETVTLSAFICGCFFSLRGYRRSPRLPGIRARRRAGRGAR